MKCTLVGINSKYIHSNLAIRYLKSYCHDDDVRCREYSINDNIDHIISDIFRTNATIVAFSCYIWNIEMVIKIIKTLKHADKSIKIVVGGPEVSYNPKEVLEMHKEIDYCIYGEGELTFKELITNLKNGDNKLGTINGLCFRNCTEIILNEGRELISNLDLIDFPYDDLNSLNNKIVYYESSRGCPFNCQYCLSSTIHGVRYFSLDRVKTDLIRLIDAKVSQVKFVDRTFNCNNTRTIEILKFLLEQNPAGINFHFEIAGDLINDEMLELLSMAPEGLFQFEIGVQSTNPQALEIIDRKMNLDKLKRNVKSIIGNNNIHIHLDLIAGLPGEDYQSFKRSFNDVYHLKPHMLQLGFLKLLWGSGLRADSKKYGIVFRDYPPYEVISTKDITFHEILKLKDIEEILEKYYNSGKFEKSLDFVINKLFPTPFDFYEEFSFYWRENELFEESHSLNNLYTIFIKFINKKDSVYVDILKDLLKFDYLYNVGPGNMPQGLESHSSKEESFQFLRNEEYVEEYLPEYIDIPVKQIIKLVHFETFQYNVLNSDLALNNKENTVILFTYKLLKPSLKKSKIHDVTTRWEK